MATTSVASPRTSWTEKQVREFIATQPSQYQNIKLPYGLETGGDDRSATSAAIFDEDLTGKTVLDIGSLTGYFCFEALKRGAKSAQGVEVNPDSVRQARALADCLGSPAQFQCADFEVDPVEGSYDYVLCLNVLHHLKNPLAALEKLIALTREKLVLEVASIGLHDRRKLGLSVMSAAVLSKAPIIYVEKLEGKSGQKFFFTPAGIERLLMSHRKVFASARILPSEHKNRFMAVAAKRRIERLIVVAGPTSAGKTTFIQRLLAGELPEAQRALEISQPAEWTAVSAQQLGTKREAIMPKVIFHYDFLRGLFKSSKTWERDEVLEVFLNAREISFVTIVAPADVLRSQIDQSEILPKTVKGVFEGNKRHLKIRKQYEDAEGTREIYRRWLTFCAGKKPHRNLVVSQQDGLSIKTADQFS